MPQIENKALVGQLIKSTIGVISRRTSEAYANLVIGNAIQELSEKYPILKYIEIIGSQFNELNDVVEINDKINEIKIGEIGIVLKKFIKKITRAIGKNEGFYFIKEIKEDLPYDYEISFKEIGLDLDFLQLDFLIKVKQNLQYKIKYSEILKYIITIVYEVLERDQGRNYAFSLLNDLIKRLSLEHQVLKNIKINDIRSMQGIDIVTINTHVDNDESSTVGAGIQKIIQEINNQLNEKGGFDFLEKLKEKISTDYNYKLRELGVDLSVIKLCKDEILKHVLKSLIDSMSDSSTKGYAILMVNNVLKKYIPKFNFLKTVKIDGIKYSNEGNGIYVSPELNLIRESKLGRSIQKIIEDISVAMGEEPGMNFIDRFKKHLGKAYVIRIEELGVNLHMIELRQNLSF